MTIRAGHEWGEPAPRPDDLTVCASDTELAGLVRDRFGGPLAVAAGDLARTVGTPGERTQLQRVEVDALVAEADGVEHLAVAHVIARRRWWRGRIVGVFNAEYLGSWDVAPRGHPNDGLAEVVEVDASMPWRARLQARRRLPSGTHVPHPSIATGRRSGAEWEFDPPLRLWVDGRPHGPVRHLAVRVVPDAFVLYV